jgi:uncharacterized membrane protein
MKSTAFIKREAMNWILLLLPFIYCLVVYDRLPAFAPFPVNWGQSIYYLLIFTMGVSFLAYLMLLIKPAIVPKTSLHENPKSLHQIKILILCFTSLLSLIYISAEIGIPFNWSKIAFLLSMAYIIAIGNLYPTLRFNFVIGIKNAWTQSDEGIWKKTHRFAGKVFFLGGLIGAIYGILFDTNPVPYMPVIWVAYVFALLLLAHVYSYMVYRKFQLHHKQ